MTLVKVIKDFIDKENSNRFVYKRDILDVSEERAKTLVDAKVALYIDGTGKNKITDPDSVSAKNKYPGVDVEKPKNGKYKGTIRSQIDQLPDEEKCPEPVVVEDE